MVKRLRLRRGSSGPDPELRLAAERGRRAIEGSGEVLVVVGDDERVIALSRGAKEVFPALEPGMSAPAELLDQRGETGPTREIYELDGQRETLIRLERPGMAAYDELRSGFTAVVSHELRTPLARLLALLETAMLPGADQESLIEQARGEIEQSRELIDEVLFLSELETGREVVALGSTPALAVLQETLAGLAESAERAGVTMRAEAGDPALAVPVRPRMLRVIAENLAENAIRYGGIGTTFVLSVAREDGRIVLRASDDGAGVPERELARLFERFYRADRARASRGTGLGLAIVKHVVTAAGGTIEAHGGPGRGLEIVCAFPE